MSRVGEEAEVAGVGGESDQSSGVGRSAADDVDHLHVPDVVNVQTLLQTHNKSLKYFLLNQIILRMSYFTDLFILTALILSL